MSSSTSSGHSDEELEASAPSAAAAPSASELGQAVELAQICSFCSTFRLPLRLPSFSRTVRRRLGTIRAVEPGGGPCSGSWALWGAGGDTETSGDASGSPLRPRPLYTWDLYAGHGLSPPSLPMLTPMCQPVLVDSRSSRKPFAVLPTVQRPTGGVLVVAQVELLAELHFKLAREHPTAKMEKMVQDWEKTLARKLQENWRKEFAANPMGGGKTYADLTVYERVKILDALCHWKLDTCAEIHKHIATLQKDNDNEAIKRLRAGEIGTDDRGVSYWYFDDGCWIYAEDKPRWQIEERKPSYTVEFASAKRIRLSINFDPDHNSSAPPLRLPIKSVAFADEIKEEKKVKKEELMVQSPSEAKVNASSEIVKAEEEEHVAANVTKTEKVDTISTSATKEVRITTVETTAAVKEETSTAEAPTTGRMDITMLCVTVSPAEEPSSAGSHQSNGSIQKENGERSSKAAGLPVASLTTAAIISPQSSAKLQEDTTSSPGKKSTTSSEKNGPGNGSPVTVNDEDNASDHTVVAVVGSKKRTIIDDDSSDSSCSDAEFPKATTGKTVELPAVSSSPPRKKRKASIENSSSATALDTEMGKDDSTKPNCAQVHGTTVSQVSESEPVATDTVETSPSVLKADSFPTVVTEMSSPSTKAKAEAVDAEDSSSSTAPKKDIEVAAKTEEHSNTETNKVSDAASAVKPSGPASTSPTDPTAALEAFDITCESCKKCYDMRYVDPPLVERPTDEWRCFECLVNDARGWPRRRKSTPREPFSPRADEASSRKRSSLSKSRSGSSSSKKSKNSSSKSRSSSSSKKKSSHSSSSKRKSSSSKSSSSRKSSSGSSSKKHKKRKSSSSSRNHHSSSSHGHHRRRHHNHYHHAEFAKLVTLFRERQGQRLGIEEARINGDLQMAFDEAPQGWRVVSSTLDNLQALIESLSGGSLEQDRLRGRLILILKGQEKLEEQRRKQQELEWNILPRRQSSRIAIGRMKNQSTQEFGTEDGYSDDDVEGRRTGLRSRRSHSVTSDGGDGQQKHDRAWRARRRHQFPDDDMDLDDEDEEVDSNGVALPTAGHWIDWSLLKGNARCLSTVCLAFVNRLLQEEAADLFSRPVDPVLDGCPNYLSVITHPMDLGTIRSRVEANFYRKWELFKKDVELVWQNCRAFNAPDTLVVQFADLLSKLSRSMCIAAEKNGADRMKDKGSGGDGSDNDSGASLSDVSKAESRGSINKAWTESSASESSDSSDGDSFSDGDNASDTRSRKRRSTRTSSKTPQTRTRSTRAKRTSSSTKGRNSRNSRGRSSRKRPAPTSSSEEGSSASGDDGLFSGARKSRRPRRGSSSKSDGKVDPPTEDEDSSGDDSAANRPPPPQNGAPSPSPPPPPPPQAVQKRQKPRLIISDSSSSDDSSDSDGNSSSSSSSDSDGSDSDTRPPSSRPQPPPPSSVEAPAPPPPSPPPPAALPEDSKPPVHSSPSQIPEPKPAASQGKKTKASLSARKAGASSGYTHSPALLNSYLSPSSSSSSDFSSGDSDSSGGDSDSD
ncbi:hypothetical protein PHYPSEUDO_005683 [Phytophthora pseudosyringae]|uniref:Bromo domain-containing protein n=1 Tax=Phytophthora pseudosyringae TaxID=221518 RepID=A0A8T1VKV7_9STRA|nr:hypothetical protein PHYPSEUDO_005683 [Phytophthora pseudosyringae]